MPKPSPSQVKILVPVWGQRYITEFAHLGLRSLLTPRNIPAAAKQWEVAFVFLTTKQGEQFIDDLDHVVTLRKFARVEYILIDDLVSSQNYGVTLTLAFARGIQATGEMQTNTVFFFMNADFFVSDGSFCSVLGAIKSGHRCIIAPSLRVISEDVRQILLDADFNDPVQMSSRFLVALAMRHLHSTTVARCINQDNVSCTQYGQFYWRVGERSMVGAHHLIFHPAIWPEAPLKTVNSYHDYCFVPEMVPSGNFHLIDDSDDFLMLELQGKFQEREMIKIGPHNRDHIRGELSLWSTREHRAFARTPVTFHADDIGEAEASARATAIEYVHRLHVGLMQPPVGHADHFYWTSGVRAWISVRKKELGSKFRLPPEIDRRHVVEDGSDIHLRYSELVDNMSRAARVRQELLEENGLSFDLYQGYTKLDDRYKTLFESSPSDRRAARDWIDKLERHLLSVTFPTNAVEVPASGIDLSGRSLGVGWSDAEVASGQTLRWVSLGRPAHIIVKLRDTNNWQLRIYLYSCPPNFLEKIEMRINGDVPKEFGIDWEVDKQCLWCNVPRELLSKSGGTIKLT